MIDDNTGKALSSIWSGAKPEDIGAGFRRANTAVVREILRQKNSSKKNRRLDKVYRKIQYMDLKAERSGRDRHPFLNGNSKFIFYLIKPPKLKKAESRTPTAVNKTNKVAPNQRIRFAASVSEHLESTSKFFVEEILPRSMSLMTAITKVDELVHQLTEDNASLPIDFIKAKSREAINLRIIRFLCKQYQLNEKEAKLMYGEFIAKMKPPLF